ncbi:MAG: tripartite tricarboxylate transporter substrate binding protein [Pigmentiphaga sp.]
MNTILSRTAAATALALLALGGAHAAYPDKPIRLIIPFAPGGGNDLTGRLIGDELGKVLGKPVVVENKGGAGSTIGTAFVAQAAPDGYTLLIVSTPYAANDTLYKNLPFNSAKDLRGVARFSSAPNVVSVYPGTGFKTWKELVDYAKANPGKLNYVSSGAGSFQHMSGEMLVDMANIKVEHIPYKGAGAAMAEVMAGHAHITIGTAFQSLSNIRSNRLVPLAVSGDKRLDILPEVPTFAEAGLPGYASENWFGVVAPAGVPDDIINTLSSALKKILDTPEIQQKLASEGANLAYLGPKDFDKYLEEERAKWSRVITQLGLAQ